MFNPTHLADIRTDQGLRSVVLQRTYVSAALEVFRDCDDAQFLQDSLTGVADWPEYQIRAFGPEERVPSPDTWIPAGPRAYAPYRPAVSGVSMVAEPSMLSC